MPLASSYSYPLLGAFWTIFEIFLWIIWFWILITVFIDIFRSPDLSGWGKALWFLFVLIIPLIGVLVYLIVRGGKMHEHGVQAAQQQDEAARAYIQQVARFGVRPTSWPSSPTCATGGSSRRRSSSSRRPRSWPAEPSGGRPGRPPPRTSASAGTAARLRQYRPIGLTGVRLQPAPGARSGQVTSLR